MKEISRNELKHKLLENINDYCMLLPFLEESYQCKKCHCYISDTDTETFLCYIKHPDDSIAVEMNVADKDTIEVENVILSLVNNGDIDGTVYVLLYKNNNFEKNLKALFDVNDVQYYQSYYAKKSSRIIDNISGVAFTVEVNDEMLDSSFISQQGNHINVIRRINEEDKTNNPVIYLVIDGEVVSYIALTTQYGNLMDVSYIFTDERYRGKGYGALLCDYAKSTLSVEGKTMFYSFAENEASERVAKKCGLEICAERYSVLCAVK